jgi:DnaJ-class molecular chaperone
MIADQSRRSRSAFTSQRAESPRKTRGKPMTSQKGPNIKKKQKCKNCEGKGLLKKGDRVVKCQRCGGTGLR